MWRLGATLIIVLKVAKDCGHGCTASVAVPSTFSFSVLPPANVTNATYSLANPVWTGVSGLAACARKTMTRCPGAGGFLYHSASGQCTSLLWLHQGSRATNDTDAPAGSFYLNNQIDLPGVCNDGFDPVRYGSEGHISCVAVLSPATTYDEATSRCNTLGGYLASVRTAEKLQMVGNLAQGNNLWVGLDDKSVEGIYRWQNDNKQLTAEEQAALFPAGEPNDYFGQEDCVHYRSIVDRLNDLPCWAFEFALCETQSRTIEC